jgi:hypothetical protein
LWEEWVELECDGEKGKWWRQRRKIKIIIIKVNFPDWTSPEVVSQKTECLNE